MSCEEKRKQDRVVDRSRLAASGRSCEVTDFLTLFHTFYAFSKISIYGNLVGSLDSHVTCRRDAKGAFIFFGSAGRSR